MDCGSVAVAKKARGVGIMVRVDPGVVRMARIVAPIKGVAVGEYISDIVRPVVKRDYLKEVGRSEAEGNR
jgi:predicted HicB family RNase H-like nuclease